MKWVLTILFLSTLSTNPTEIARNNQLKNKAAEAFSDGKYELAAQNYSILYDTLGVNDPAIGLNLAHSYYALGDTSNAKLMYQNIAASNNNELKSIAYQQLGVMSKTPQTLNESLQYLKSALKANPLNEEARYDYEVVKKLIEQQKENQQNQDQDNQDQNKENQDNQDQKNQDQQNEQDQEQENKEQENQEQQQDQENKEGEEGEEEQQEQKEQKDGEEQGEEEQKQPQEGEEEQEGEEQKEQSQPSTEQKLEEMNISEEKARMILEAMRNNEIQYIQQQKRKATKPHDSGKPDW